MDQSVFHSYECANQTRLPTKLKREINENRDRFNMAAYGRKTLSRFLQLDLRFRDRMSDPFEKNPQIANLVFYLWIFFQPPVSITTLATAKKLSMGPYGKEPMSQFFRWVLYVESLSSEETQYESEEQ